MCLVYINSTRVEINNKNNNNNNGELLFRPPTFTISAPWVKTGVISFASILFFSNTSCRFCSFFFHSRALLHNLEQINHSYVELPPHQQLAVRRSLQELLYRPSNLPQGPRGWPAGSANRRTNDRYCVNEEGTV